MRYVTTTEISKIPSLAGLAEDAIAAAVTDSDTVRGLIDQTPWITDTDLRAQLEQDGWTPDRTTLAIGVLLDTEQVMQLPDAQAASTGA